MNSIPKYKFIHWWCHHGAKIILSLMVMSLVFNNMALKGISMIMLMSVPCNVKIINTNKYLWYLRQVLFLLLGLYDIFYYEEIFNAWKY